MFHDAKSDISRPPTATGFDFVANSVSGGDSSMNTSHGKTAQLPITSNGPNKVGVQEQPLAAVSPKGSFFSRGISSIMGSALGTVATYVNQSFLSGIPFHIADRALRESKATYAKWWEDGINSKKRNRDDGEDEGIGSQKKQKLESGHGCASALSVSLGKNYKDMGIDTSTKFAERGSMLRHTSAKPKTQQPLQTGSAVAEEVDSSIIKPRQRRSQFDRKKKSAPDLVKDKAATNDAPISGYNAFNNIGGMYDFGDTDDVHGDENEGNEESLENQNGAIVSDHADDVTSSEGDTTNHHVKPAVSSLTYDSLDSYYVSNEANEDNGDEVEAAASALTSPKACMDSTSDGKGSTSCATITGNGATRLDGTLSAIQALLEEKNRASEESELVQMIRSPREWVKKSIRSEMIEALQLVRGDVTDKRFLSSLEILGNFYKTSGRDARVSPWARRRSISDPCLGGGLYGYAGSEVGGPTAHDLLEGNWVNMSRPNYVECLGQNGEDDFMYTLGRMSFDMFQPGGLVCSVQSTHNTIKIIGEREELPSYVPTSLREEVASLCGSGSSLGDSGSSPTKRPLLRSYDIAVSLTIEPPSSVGQPEPPTTTPSPTKRMRAIMSVKGYVLPDPETPNRLTVWFTGGKLSPARLAHGQDGAETDDEDQAELESETKPSKEPHMEEDENYGGFEEWSSMFAKGKWRKTLGERARAMAAKLLLGADVPNKMEEEGHMEYTLHRPVGGHGKVYVDVLYLDEDILIMQGHHGTIYAMARSGVSQRYRAMRSHSSTQTGEEGMDES
jgi:hypothetical protein